MNLLEGKDPPCNLRGFLFRYLKTFEIIYITFFFTQIWYNISNRIPRGVDDIE